MKQYPNSKLITLYKPQDEAEMAIISSLLEAEGIRFSVTNIQTQSLFGAGVLGTGYNLLSGPITIQILEEDRKRGVLVIERYLAGDSGRDQDTTANSQEPGFPDKSK